MVETPDRGERLKVHSSVSPEKGKFLKDLVIEQNARTTLETGCCYGISGLWICEGLREVQGERHIVIDPFQTQRHRGVGIANLHRAGYGDLVEFHELPAHLALPELEKRGQVLDFAFIDGWHTFDYALVDFFFIDHMLRVGGIVALDDVNMVPLKKLTRYLLTNRNYSVHRCFVDRTEPWFGRTDRVLYHSAKRCEPVRRYLKPETAVRGIDLGIASGSTAIALIKNGDDDRRYDFHAEF
jgi:predicted O-methyltransferase YrrM